MKILITGANGQLGNELTRQLNNKGSVLGPLPHVLNEATFCGIDIEDGDLADLDTVYRIMEEQDPDVVINCAAYTNVDGCETERDTAFKANAVAPRNLAISCEALKARLIHISTDYVFSGEGNEPFVETTLPAPRSVYGSTKLLGEEYVRQFCRRWFILRTSWLYGRIGGNFVKTIQRVAKEKGSLKVVMDQLGNPTNAEDLAHHILRLLPTGQYGLYHCTGEGTCSWYDFAREIVGLSGIDAEVIPCTTEEYEKISPGAAPRPSFSALDNAMLRATVGNGMRPWQEALQGYINEQKNN